MDLFAKSLILLLTCVLACPDGYAQAHKMYMNYDYQNPEKDKVFGLWKQYLNQKNDKDTLWSAYDRDKFKGTDLLKDCCGLSGSLYKITFDCNVTTIAEQGENYLLTSVLYWNEQDSLIPNRFTLFGIVNVLAVKEHNTYKLSNYINYATANWMSRQLGRIHYHYPPEYPFDIFKSQTANSFLDSLTKWFNCTTDTINYYIPPNCSDGLKMVGFQYYEGNGSTLNLCGFYDDANNIIYSNFIQGECYKHELIHVINRQYPNANTYLLSGLAAYIDDAGSRGKPERFHIQRYMEYLKTHPADLNKFYEIDHVDEVTAPNYVFGATICNALLRKGGLPLLKRAMMDTKKDAQLVTFLEKELGVKDFNTFFSKEFGAYLAQKDVLLKTEKE